MCTCLVILSLVWPRDRRLQPKSSSVVSEGLSHGVLKIGRGGVSDDLCPVRKGNAFRQRCTWAAVTTPRGLSDLQMALTNYRSQVRVVRFYTALRP